ncbi:SEC-C metal-binding domain-containing protein [Chlamydiales bacterium]|nr:SEC-C metal-binding domain-containing protein [Chlamydiales bacterium]
MSKKAGRNDPCPCGSGKKYKSCCWGKELPQSDASRRSLFGRAVSGTTSNVKRKFTAKVLSQSGPKDIVERTFSASLTKSRSDDLPPSPPSETIPEQKLPEDYKEWNPDEKKD